MAKHKYDGTWNYFEMSDSTLSVPARRDDLILAIPHEEGEVDETNSSQAGFPVDGNATNNGLSLTRTERNNKRTLKGKTVFEKMCDGVLHVVIVGRFKDEDTNGPALTAQNEGTWVVSKP
jgi:hypothetical protein